MGAAASRQSKCNARNRSGVGRCRRPAGWGTDHVGWGECKLHAGSTLSGRTKARNAEIRALAQPLHIEPHAAIQQSLDNANGRLAYFEVKVAALPERAVISKGELNAWIRESDRLNGDVAHYAKLALDAGVDERRVRVAEAFGDQLAVLIGGIFNDPELKLTAEQRRAAQPVVRRHLELLEGEEAA